MGCCIRMICSDICNKWMNLNAHLFWTLASPHCKESTHKQWSSTYVRPKKGGGVSSAKEQRNRATSQGYALSYTDTSSAISHSCGSSVLWQIFLHFVTLFYSILLDFSLLSDLTQVFEKHNIPNHTKHLSFSLNLSSVIFIWCLWDLEGKDPVWEHWLFTFSMPICAIIDLLISTAQSSPSKDDGRVLGLFNHSLLVQKLSHTFICIYDSYRNWTLNTAAYCHCYAYHWGKKTCNTKRCPNRNIQQTATARHPPSCRAPGTHVLKNINEHFKRWCIHASRHISDAGQNPNCIAASGLC